MNNLTFADLKTQFDNAAEKIYTMLLNDLNRNDHRKINLLLLNQITVEYFESQTAVRFLVNVKPGKVGDYFLEPFDQALLKKIYHSLVQAKTNWQISLQPQAIRIALPFLTTEAKQKLSKEYRQFGEKAQISLRQLRQQFHQKIKTHFQAKDAQFQMQENLQKSFQLWKEKFNSIVSKVIAAFSKV